MLCKCLQGHIVYTYIRVCTLCEFRSAEHLEAIFVWSGTVAIYLCTKNPRFNNYKINMDHKSKQTRYKILFN